MESTNCSSPFEFMRSVKFYTDQTYGLTEDDSDIDWIVSKLRKQRLNGKHVDVTLILKSEREPLRVHGALLCMYSPVIDSMLSSDMVEARTRRIDMTAYEPHCVSTVIDYMYSCNISLIHSNIVGIFEFVNAYMIKKLSQLCIDYICNSIDESNIQCIRYLNTIITSNDVSNAIIRYMVENMINPSLTDLYVNLSFTELQSIILYDIKHYTPKRRIRNRLIALLNYVSHDIDNRACHLNYLVLRDVVPDISLLSRRSRLQILDSYPDTVINRELSILFDSVPALSTFEPMSITSNVYTIVHASSDDDDDTVNAAILSHPIANRHVTGISVYYNEIYNARTVKILTGLSVLYNTDDISYIGKTLSNYCCGTFRLSTNIDERITNVTIRKYGYTIYSITFTSNITNYGPYGTINIPNLDELTTVRQLVPAECSSRTDYYLASIDSLPVFGIPSGKLVFTWIAG